MRLTIMPLIATATLLTGLALTARSIGTPERGAANAASTDISAAKKKKKKTDDSQTTPTAPSTDGKSTY